ncbi:sialate O-acetylesterase [Loktanella sp. TSTF-M6]|uniref:Sialate O-acetylesterase n=1 Tax=Loktanella gaetbuli TaxID=2881335 RepID=A0ABS8BTF1_9RHOB|nr:sialate O-acetylesterase [Loktanella gaetbuli]MCB5199007.1 sialate O-acetylesterase [Loktanella gaetbuli]
MHWQIASCTEALLRQMRRFLFYVFLFATGTIYGISVIAFQVFPYDLMKRAKDFAFGTPTAEAIDPSLHGHIERFIDTSGRSIRIFQPTSRDCIFAVYGQSNAANSGQFGYASGPGIFQFFEGDIYDYVDPALGGTRTSGSVWGRVGDILIDDGACDQVVFAVTAAGDQTISELSTGSQFDFFTTTYSELQNSFGHVDAILIHQGESNNANRQKSSDQTATYREQFIDFLDNTRNADAAAPMLLARASFCGHRADETLVEQQNAIISLRKDVEAGPNSDLLFAPQYRLPDGCHFSAEGLDQLAQMWANAIQLQLNRR